MACVFKNIALPDSSFIEIGQFCEGPGRIGSVAENLVLVGACTLTDTWSSTQAS